MKRDREAERSEWASECASKASMTLDELGGALLDYKQAHETWMALDEPKPRGREYCDWLESKGFDGLAKAKRANFDLPDLNGHHTIDEWINDAKPLTAFAVLKDNEWAARGTMGWWACVSDERDDWDSQCQRLIDSIRDDQWITVVDCHI